ncbi:Short chain dehydrogenase [Lachnellula subtilissima]|uniref:Short chain dehydrogenase n=1 Tax=Lachnellula subtilissima TaxID=602034 RepID=A0A8H8UFC4_9HELO|nr:Short chain dehydrogenase [Lachnellula subtilissima]
MQAPPTYTKIYRTQNYPAIHPTRPELSTAGKVVIITGGGSGIGPKIAHAFATSGATKISILGRTASSLLTTKTSIESQHPGVKVLTFVADISNQAAVIDAFESTKKTFGPVDILVGNAGYMPNPAPLASTDITEWMRGLDINVRGNLILYQAFIANSSLNPTLVHVGTAAANLPAMPGGLSAYAVSKLAATKMTDYFAFENPNVRVMIVHPGVPDTSMNEKARDVGLVMPFDDIELCANFMVWAVSPEAEFLKGKFIWSNWDVNDLIAKKDSLSAMDLTTGLLGWP